MSYFHCLGCGQKAIFVDKNMRHETCLGGRVIPIATLCDPPEPTVIDESDLAPGMVVVAVDDMHFPKAFLCSPDAALGAGYPAIFVNADRMCFVADSISVASVLRVAGEE